MSGLRSGGVEDATPTTTQDSTLSIPTPVMGDVVWDFDKVKRLGTDQKHGSWKCLWCSAEFKGWNATKVLAHLSKTKGRDIKACVANIVKESLIGYKALLKKKDDEKAKRKRSGEQFRESLEATQDSNATLLEQQSKRPHLFQGQIDAGGKSKLTMAIADFVFSKGLAFSATEGQHFKRILELAKCVPSTYVPPARKQICGELLTLNYNQKIAAYKVTLLKEADIFGLTLFGDGATVRRMPLINIMASGVYETAAVLEIVDCSAYLASGGKKDAKYISSLFLPHMSELDPQKRLIDLLFFDGASNVQLAGALCKVHFPRITVLHGAEHVVSLFFADVAKLPPIKRLITVYRNIYSIFGSGARHAPYALFKAQSLLFNHGRGIGLIRAADTRMAGYFIALHRMLRLKNVLQATVSSVQFQELKLGIATKWVTIIQDQNFWTAVYLLLRSIFPALRVLCLADKATAGMDKLYYCVRMTDSALEKSLKTLDDVDFFSSDVYHLDKDTDRVDADPDVNQSTADDSTVDSADDDGDNSEKSEDDESVEESTDLGTLILLSWNKRRLKLASDFAIAAWMLCPIDEIMNHVKENRCGEHNLAMDRVIKVMFYDLDPALLAVTVDIFWTEFEAFHGRRGTGHPAFDRDYIWNSQHLREGSSHLWHKQYSVHSTTILGKVACRLTSKILGIGSAERSWGAVKHLKTDKRSHLGHLPTKMQSTLFGASCIEAARRRHKLRSIAPTTVSIWAEEDVEFDLQLENWGTVIELPNQQPVRIFNNWVEDWEKEIRHVEHILSKEKLLLKYRYLEWEDPDNGKLYVADANDMTFQRGKRGCGWCITGNETATGDWQPFALKFLNKCIARWNQPAGLNVTVVPNPNPKKKTDKSGKKLPSSDSDFDDSKYVVPKARKKTVKSRKKVPTSDSDSD